MATSADLLRGLNERQVEAVTHLKGPLLVVAGAGSGKTRVITHRIANLIEHNVHPTRILAITFTNKAAGEMRERVEKLIGISTPWITTFHSAGLKIIKEERGNTGYPPEITILDTDDQLKLIRRVLEGLKLDPKIWEPRELQGRISQRKNNLELPSDIQLHGQHDVVLQQVYEHYRLTMLKEGLLDFDDLLMVPVKLFQSRADIRKRWVDRFEKILIDEYQDTNQAQYQMIHLLSDHQEVCATGDPDQAIYGWRGADLSNILNFKEHFPTCTTILLEQNYRSTANILTAAQAVVEHNRNRFEKRIFTQSADGRPITVITVDDPKAEALAVVGACQALTRSGQRRLRDIAIFYRTNAQSRDVEECLIRERIPYKIIGGLRYYDRAEVKDLLAYLKLLINPRDTGSFERILGIPARGIGERVLETLTTVAQERDISLLDALVDDAVLERIAIGKKGRAIAEYAQLWKRLRIIDKSKPAALIEELLSLTGLPKWYMEHEKDPQKGQERAQNVEEMVVAAQEFEKGWPGAGLEGFLEQVSLMSAVDNKLSADEDSLILMTLHASKGLEFPVVFIIGCEHGLLPLIGGRGREPDYEEERRLMYVGITRAQEDLFLSHVAIRTQFGRTVRNAPSMFLAEIPDKTIRHLDRTTSKSLQCSWAEPGPEYPESSHALVLSSMRSQKEALGAIRRERPHGGALVGALASRGCDQGRDIGIRKKEAAETFTSKIPLPKPGMRVMHQTFGHGVVVKVSGRGEDARITFDFDDFGQKEIPAEVAMKRLQSPD